MITFCHKMCEIKFKLILVYSFQVRNNYFQQLKKFFNISDTIVIKSIQKLPADF